MLRSVLYWLAVALLATLVYLVAGLLIRRRRPPRPARLAGALFLVACSGAAIAIGDQTLAPHALLAWGLGAVLFPIFFYLNADARYQSRGMRWLAVVYGLNQIGLLFGPSSSHNAGLDSVAGPSLLHGLQLTGDVFRVVLVGIGIAPQVYARHRRLCEAGASLRAGARGLVGALAAGALAVAAMAVVFEPPAGAPPAPPALAALYLGAALVPVPLGFTVLHARPYDRDALVYRALLYGLLTLSLIAVYAACVAAVSRVLLGGAGTAQLAILGAALAVAGLFRPLRAALADALAHWLAPGRREAARVFAALAAAAPAEIHLDALCDRLTVATRAAMAADSATLWLRTAPSLSARAMGHILPAAAAAGRAGGTVDLQASAWQLEASRRPAPPLTIAPDDPLRAALSPGAGAADADDLPAGSPAVRALRAAGVKLALPLVDDGEPLGLLALGPRRDPRRYAYEDRELLDALATRVAPALRTALLVQEQETEARERARVEQELRTARLIQQSLLPRDVPALPGWHIATYYEPAREVGGDFYDFLPLGDGRVGFVVGDVSGKGVPAALVMATTRSMLRATAQASTPTGAVLARVNDLLCADLPPGVFVTCFYAILDPATGGLRYANAGHDLPYLRRAGGAVEDLRARGMPLGLMAEMAYDEGEARLGPGDAVLFYSDGLVEAHGAGREMFGFGRLARLLTGAPEEDGTIGGLLRELAAFTGPGWEQEDDVTLVTLLRRAVAADAV